MIRLIAAIDRQRGLAKQGFQPWHIPDDEAYFTNMTKQFDANVLIGSSTFKTFNGPLTDRNNFVLTRDNTPIEDVELVHDLEHFLNDFTDRNLWVAGGANVFAQVLELGKADEIYITQIEADFGCNQFFPQFEDKFTLIEKSEMKEQNGFIFAFKKYVKQS